MDFWDALILGVIEGVTEFLPISSTAHLILGAELLGIPSSEFLKSFEIAIQLGAILAVVTLYWRSFLDVAILKKVALGFVPTAILGLMFYKVVKMFLDDISVVLSALLIGGVLLIIFEKWHKGRVADRTEMTAFECCLIGICQSFAFIPGVSRAAATIVGGLAMGISRATITEYSFLLAVPTMAAATGLDLIKNREVIMSSGNLSMLLVGLFVSYVVAITAIKFLVAYIRAHDFKPFGIYRIVVALAGYLILVVA